MTALKIIQNKQQNGRLDFINHALNTEPITGVLFTQYITKIISQRIGRNADVYRKNYNTLIKHLDNFSRYYNATLYTNSINKNFLSVFTQYLESLKLRKNYIKQLVSQIKGMANSAADDNYLIDPTYKKFEYEGEETFAIYLTKSDIDEIFFKDGLTKAQERIRDMFVVGCYTGLRFSDYNTLTDDNFQGDKIVKITKKTKKKVVIPKGRLVQRIYQKYDGNLHLNKSIQHFNRYIKEICKQVGGPFLEPVKRNVIIDNQIVTITKPKYEFISSHTARRSFATNMLLEGLKAYQIMVFTGHTTEKSFFRYIRITQDEVVREVENHRFFTN